MMIQKYAVQWINCLVDRFFDRKQQAAMAWVALMDPKFICSRYQRKQMLVERRRGLDVHPNA